MGIIKKFDSFLSEKLVAAAPAPVTTPTPTITPTRPDTKPSTRPGKPSPIRRDKPAVEPAPKAEKKLKEATMEEVIQKFANLTNQNY